MTPGPGPAWKAAAAAALLVQAAGAGLWWWGAPQGFPPGHAQWWANEVAPWLVAPLCVAGAVAAVRRPSWTRVAVLVLAAGWLGLTVGGLFAFSRSGHRWALCAAVPTAAWLALASWRRRRDPLVIPRGEWLFPAVGAIGVALAFTQRAGTPDTHPAETTPVPADAPGTGAADVPARWPIDLGTGRVTLRSGGGRLSVEPLLALHSVSPDGGWTLLSPERRWPDLLLRGWREADGALHAAWATPDGRQRTRAVVTREGDAVRVDARTTLTEAVYTHLNAFTHLSADFAADTRLEVAFSPCPDARIEVLPTDYPVGRPMRLAFLDDAAAFRVVEATSGEKGPFRELARGPLVRGQPLSVVILADGAPAFEVTWEDWSAQAATALSPTAGWGVPQNAFELQLAAPGCLDLWCSLAATSVGRGWHSVGHAAGTYRNRVVARAR